MEIVNKTAIKKGNLFARELEKLLSSRGQTLWGLAHVPIHNERIRRLIQSLEQPRKFTTLNRKDMQRVQEHFDFSEDEILHFRAVVMTTAIQQTLAHRINPDLGWQVAMVLLPMIENIIREDAKLAHMLDTIEGLNENQDSRSLEQILDPLIERLDEALLAQHMSEQAISIDERLINAHLAEGHYQGCVIALEQLPKKYQQTVEWTYWHEEGINGIEQIAAFLNKVRYIDRYGKPE